MRKTILYIFLIAILLNTCAPADIAPMPVAIAQTTPESGPVLISTVEVTPTQMSSGVVIENDECDNPYYPVVNGAWWQYNISTGVSATHSMSASGKVFSVTVEGGKGVFTFDGSCTDDGIILLEVPGVSSSYKGDGGGSTLTTTNDDGVTLPNDIQIGDEWSQSISVVGNSGELTMSAHLEMNHKAVGYEGVSTPIGMVNALKVEQSGTLSLGGETMLDIHGYIWYGQGIGVVKNTVDGAFEATLVTYNIPQP